MLGKFKQACDCYLISFKLETDKDLLQKKVQESFQKYGVDMVFNFSKKIIGNLLHSRRDIVQIWVGNSMTEI